MKSKLLLFLTVTILFFVICGFYVKNMFLPVSTDAKSVDFLIPKGSSVSIIANNLKKAGLIKNAIVFKIYIQITSSQNKIQAGEFQLAPSFTLSQIVDKLKKGPSEIWVTIPEGLRREEIALKFKTTLNKSDEFVVEFMNLTVNKEGYLFPDTYLFPKAATASQIVNKLTNTFDSKVETVTYKQVIMASMLERETISDDEKPIVAGILYKRIKNDWPLQVDATIQYAKGNWEPIYSIDKNIVSPFNTYKNLGMPPSPIANAGLSSIEAAINPEESDYWYYIHDDDGKIHFARTLEEHNANIAKYLR
ncbi:MAG: endolytic transglycosylase MltG [Patescibacteria group bacterium]